MEPETPPNNGESSNPEPKQDLPNPNNGETDDTHETHEDFDSTCSTPYVSAPSSPGRGPVSGFFYSAPASPMHFALASSSLCLAQSSSSSSSLENNSMPLSFEFEFSARFASTGSAATGSSMSSADELFLNGQIRPMKLSTHLERPQVLAPLLDLDPEAEEDAAELTFEPVRGRDLRLRDKSLRRRARSMSPLKTTSFEWSESEKLDENDGFSSKDMKGGDLETNIKNHGEEALSSSETTTPSVSASSSRSSSAGRNSKRWVFLKDFLYRSKSEGRSNNKFWSTLSFSPAKEKKTMNQHIQGSVSKEKISNPSNGASETQKGKGGGGQTSGKKAGKPANGVGKRRVPPSPHELHYTANRAQAEELRKKTYLPYRQGLLGCLGFSSKGYGAMNGFARALNPVSSR
ncbi:hypothetical protein FEM48_Zijuj02G0132600 [Ziziphus jujuba var. spinosa]|uniref:Stress response NST1-like protein n=1 Tax=Ziziphus jujuba var. spinosa TaxID=714518 RepID=A0A978VVY0_ZIZJJ|nr:hypothetical protein FEM48_Zijuj02G0132600 [Ziziphus jujuba var. spinosa]